MSDDNTDLGTAKFKNFLYQCSKKHLFETAEETICRKFGEWVSMQKFDNIDTVFYSIDLNKLSAQIALCLIENSKYYQENLIMRNTFINECKAYYPNKNIFNGF